MRLNLVFKIIKYIIFCLATLFLLLLLCVNLPPGQRFITARANSFFLEKGIPVHIERLTLLINGTFGVRQMRIMLDKQDTVVYARYIRIAVRPIPLFFKKVKISSIRIDHAVVNIAKDDSTGLLNLVSIFPATKKDKGTKKKKPNPWDIQVKSVNLKNIRFTYRDPFQGIQINPSVKILFIRFSRFSLLRKEIKAAYLDLEGVRGDLVMKIPPMEKDSAVTKPSAWKFSLQESKLKNIYFSLDQPEKKQRFNVTLGSGVLSECLFDMNRRQISVAWLKLDKPDFTLFSTPDQSKRATPSSKAPVVSFPGPWGISGNNLTIKNGSFQQVQYDGTSPQKPGSGLNSVDNLNTIIKDLRLTRQASGFNMSRLSFNLGNGVQLEQGRLVFSSDSTLKSTLQIALKTKFSKAEMKIEAGDELSSIIGKSLLSVPFTLKISQSEISPKDLFAFLPQFRNQSEQTSVINNVLNVKGSFTGSSDLLKIDNFNLSTPAGASLLVSGYITHLTNLHSAKCEINFRSGTITQKQISELAEMAGKSLKLPSFGPLNFQGSIGRSIMEPELSLTIGGASGDIGIEGSIDLADKSYAMKLLFSGLELGELAGFKDVDRVSGSINLTGKGFNPDSLQAVASVTIDTAGFKRYKYHHVNLDLKADKGHYSFNILSSDIAARCDLSGNFSMKDSLAGGQVSGNFAIQPYKLKLYKDSIHIKGELKAALHQAHRRIDASADLDNVILQKGERTASLKTASFSLNSSDSLIKARVEAAFLKADFLCRGSFNDLKKSFILHGVKGISLLDSAMNGKLPIITDLPEMKFSVVLDYDPLIGYFVPDSVFGFYHAVFELTKDTKGKANGELSIDKYNFKKIYGFSTSMQFESSPDKSTLVVKTDSLKAGIISLGASVFGLNFNKGKADLRVKIGDRNDRVLYDIAFGAIKTDNRIELSSTQPEWILNGYAWTISPPEFLVLEAGTNDFKADLHWKNKQSIVDIYGTRSEKLHVDCREVGLSMLVMPGILPYDFDGELSGKIEYWGKNQNSIDIQLDIIGIKMSGQLLGNLKISGNYLSDTLGNSKSDLHAVMNDTSELMVKAKIGIDPGSIQTEFKNIPVNYLEPFVRKYLSGITGKVSGEVLLTSIGNNPKLNGRIELNETGFRIIPLNAKFNIPKDEIKLDDSQMLFNQFLVLDSLKKRLNVNGKILLKDLGNITADLQITSDNLQVMNTTEKDNPAFYGSVLLNSKLKINGPVQKPSISGNLVLAGGTVINYRYMENLTVSETQKTITFASLREDQAAIRNKREAMNKLSNSPNLEASIEIDPKSVFNFQINRGFDIGVKISGSGFLNYTMLPNSTISLSGTYEIQRGSSELKIIGWPRKYFTISPGSYLKWNGKMDDPELQIETISKVKGSYLNPVDNKNREVDFKVYMKLANRLSQLDIVFDVISDDQYITSVLSSLSKDERMRQAINLLIFERIELPNMSSSSNYVSQQINQFWESQLNQFTKSAIKNVDISFGLNTYTGASESGGEQEYTSFTYEVKKEMFHERGSVMVSGRMNDNSVAGEQTNNMIDNFTFEYALDTNRSKYMKVYRQQNYEDLLEGEVIKSGVGFIYRKNYDRVTDIWRRKKKKIKD
jgi:translocation and assembly module TamB